MILAAADLGRYDEGTPPPPLVAGWQMKRWAALPEAGGLRDQPAGLLTKAGYLMDVYQAHRAYRDALLSYSGESLSKWEERNDGIMQILANIRQLEAKVNS